MADSGQSNSGGNAGGRRDAAELTAIGGAGGMFSGLFGVGGGTVMVPLLVLVRGFGEKKATGTSLMAIIVIAVFGVIGNQLFGSVDYAKGVLIGVPAVAGVVAGTTLQQRLSDRMLSGMFAGLMIVVAIIYIVSSI